MKWTTERRLFAAQTHVQEDQNRLMLITRDNKQKESWRPKKRQRESSKEADVLRYKKSTRKGEQDK